MTILYQCDEYPPVRNGGIGTVVKLVAESMAFRGHRVLVVGDYSNQTSKIERLSEINGVRIIRFKKSDFKTLKLLVLKFVLLCLQKLKIQSLINRCRFNITIAKHKRTETLMQKLIDVEKVDILELVDYQDFLLHTEAGKMKYRKFSIPTIMRIHGSVSFLSYYLENNIKDFVLENDKAHFQRADAICAVSQFSAEFINRYIPDATVDVIYNPIENIVFHNTKEYPEPKTVLFFGKILKSKGAFSLIKAYNIVAEDFPDVELVLIGNGAIEDAKNLVSDANVDRVHFKCFMPKEELMKEIDKAYICVLPSYFENFSMAALEVLARGRALIYTERSSGSELIEDGVNGWLVNPDDIEQIADKMKQALENPQKTEAVARNGQATCLARFSTDVIIPELETYYQKIIDEYQRNNS